MIGFTEAGRAVLHHCPRLPPITNSFVRWLGFVLAQTICARTAPPRFDASAADGYAVRSVDIAVASRETPVTLVVQEIVYVGIRGM